MNIKLSNRKVIESSSLFMNLPEHILTEIDLFFSNTNLTEKQQLDLMKIFKSIYSEGYEKAQWEDLT